MRNNAAKAQPESVWTALDKPVPQWPEGERVVLGSVLIEPNAWGRVIAILEEDDFLQDANRYVFAACRRLAEANDPIDLVTVKGNLLGRGELEKAGGHAYVSSLIDGVPDIANVERYARGVRERSERRKLIVMGNAVMREAFDHEHSAGEIAANFELRLNDVAVREETGPQPIGAISRVEIKVIEDRVVRVRDEGVSAIITGLRSGLRHLDSYTLGFARGAETIIGARTRIGKTTFVHEAILESMRRDQRVLYLQFDMPKSMVTTRLLANIAGVPTLKIQSGIGVTNDELSRLGDADIYLRKLADRFLVDTSTRELVKIAAHVRRIKRQGGLDGIILDHVGHVRGGKGEKRYREIADVVQRLIELAGECNAALVTLVQLGREAEKRVPVLADLRESGDLEQDARTVLLLDRKAMRGEKYTTGDVAGALIPHCELDIIVAKNEGEAGETFTAHMDMSYQRVTTDVERNCGLKGCPHAPEPETPFHERHEERALFQQK